MKYSTPAFLLFFLSIAFGVPPPPPPPPPSLWSASHVYFQPGDILLGAVFSVNDYSDDDYCGSQLRETGVLQHIEALSYAVRRINVDVSLLPRHRLGFVVVDDCLKPKTGLAQSLRFVPLGRTPCNHTTAECRDGRNDCACFLRSGPDVFFDVAGVIGAESSPSSIAVSNLLALHHLPQVSPSATSDLLSDTKRFPNFLRLATPDQLQVAAILRLLRHFDWNHVSVVYARGGYGEEAFHRLYSDAKNATDDEGEERRLCFGATRGVSQGTSAAEYDRVIDELVEAGAAVVVLFLDQEEVRNLWLASRRATSGQFIWIGSDGVGLNVDDFDGLENVIAGSLMLKTYIPPVNDDFTSYFLSLRPESNSNPWFSSMWELLFQCNMTTGSCPLNLNISDAGDYTPETMAPFIIDIVYTFAHAIDNLTSNCTHHEFRRCVGNQHLLEQLGRTTFRGFTGNISFDKNGDALGKYDIANFGFFNGSYRTRRVGEYDSRSNKLTINEAMIEWNRNSTKTPSSSRCRDPCSRGQIRVYLPQTCCWACRTCANNEIVMHMNSCSACPEYTWPDDNKTTCRALSPRYIRPIDAIAVILLSIGGVGFVACIIVCAIVIRHREARIIKATSRELSAFMLVGVLVQYLMLIPLVCKPSKAGCIAGFLGFNISFCAVYAPLLTRTNRIFRIFNAGKHTKALPSLTSPCTQVLISAVLVMVQICINVVVMLIEPPDVMYRQPRKSVPVMEMRCRMPFAGFIAALVYNLVLVCVCTYYAFRTRRLPDNFNESRCISFCVYTTIVIWLAFVPTYFTSDNFYLQVVLLSCALVLNASVTLLSLYVPRLYLLRTRSATPPSFTIKYRLQQQHQMTTSMIVQTSGVQQQSPDDGAIPEIPVTD